MRYNTNQHETSTQIIPFSFEGHDVRVITQNDEPWWVATDVCKVHEHTNNRKAVERLDNDEKGVTIVYTPGGLQEMAHL